MFPLPWNKAYRKKDGSLTTLDDAIQGGGGQYELPTASANTKGGVKIGSRLSMDGEVLSADAQLPAYSSSESGKVLGVDAHGALEWATPGGSGGGGISYVDVTFNEMQIAANSFGGNSAAVNANNYPALLGKRIVSVTTLGTPNYVYCIGASRQSDPVAANDWIYLGFYNNSSVLATVSTARIFYM